jgi:hypothetical protein
VQNKLAIINNKAPIKEKRARILIPITTIVLIRLS